MRRLAHRLPLALLGAIGVLGMAACLPVAGEGDGDGDGGSGEPDAAVQLDAGSAWDSGAPSDPDGGVLDDAGVPRDAGFAGSSRFPYDSTFPVAAAAVENPGAYIPSLCYAKTQDAEAESDAGVGADGGAGAGRAHDSCSVCHTLGLPPNYIDDRALGKAYAFPAPALDNPWTNLFEDFTADVAAISDEAILQYIRTDNYRAADGTIILADLLRHPPPTWDEHQDGHWDGYVPDAYFEFDAQGFDRDPAGGYTGWRAYASYPFPGAFMPTNGSTADALIRLEVAFRTDEQGQPSLAVYRVNLAIVEALITRHDVPIEPTDERALGVDLDRDGQLQVASRVTYSWAPLEGRTMSYVGLARRLQAEGQLVAAAGLFPRGTEFLHSVRYIDVVAGDGGVPTVGLAPRMKELRYARKAVQYTFFELEQVAHREGRERALDPDSLREVSGSFEGGLFTQGWRYQGFIEDRHGDLRPQTREETLFCMGCHSGLGATTDTNFSFRRKLGAARQAGGWFHWTQGSLVGVAEPLNADGHFEYSDYLARNGAGDEFRGNDEVQARFFDAAGELQPDAVARLHGDVSLLLLPSPARALVADKAYRVLVQGQRFTRGRDAHVGPVEAAHRLVSQGLPTGL
jgi:mono/diheme cytochrome c family protein